jgi:hypothetical protein
MATAITSTVGAAAADNNTYASKGRKTVSQAYEATSIPLFATGAVLQIFNYAQLTGAMTINAATTLANLTQWDEVLFVFEGDASERIVTFGTGFKSSGTVTIPANKGARCRGLYDGTSICIYAREIYA